MSSEGKFAEAREEVPVARTQRPWFKRLGMILLALFLILAALHRPILLTAGRLALIKVAARQNVKLEVQLSGTIFTNLTVRNVHARPIGESPVHKIDIELVRLNYNLFHLVRDGLGEFLQFYEIKNADLVLNATKGSKEQRRTLAQDLNNLLQQPAFYSDAVRIENFNIVVRADNGETQAQGLHLLLDPHREGHLRIGRLQIPRVHVWENLACATSYEKRNFYLSGLELSPEAVIDQFNFDASRRAENKGSVILKGRFFGGTLDFLVTGQKLQKKGKNLDKSFDGRLKIDAANVSLAEARDYFQVKWLPKAILERFALDVGGEPEIPTSWNGSAVVELGAMTAGKFVVEHADATVTFTKGVAIVTPAKAVAGANYVTVNSRIALPDSVNDFDQSGIEGAVVITAPALAALAPRMSPPLQGAVEGGGPFRYEKREASAKLQLHATHVGNEAAEGSGELAITVAKHFDPGAEEILDNLRTDVIAQASELRVGSYQLGRAYLAAENRGAEVTVRKLTIAREENWVSANGTFHIPRPGASFGDDPLQAAFSLNLPDLKAFGVAQGGEALDGEIKGSGEVAMVNGSYSGTVLINGRGFKIGEFAAETLEVQATAKDGLATVDEFSLVFDKNNRVQGTGTAAAQRPYGYDAALTAAISDLGVFAPLWEIFGHKQALRGAVEADWKGRGTVSPSSHSGGGKLVVKGAQFGSLKVEEARLAGDYTPQTARFPDLHVAAFGATLDSQVDIRERRLQVRELIVRQGRATVMSGSATIPFDLEHLDDRTKMLPPDEPLDANLKIEKLELAKLGAHFEKPLPVTGSLSATLAAGGTMSAPTVALQLAARALRNPAATKLGAANLDVAINYQDQELRVRDLIVQQDSLPVISGWATIPLDISHVRDGAKMLPPNGPIEAKFTIEKLELAKLGGQLSRPSPLTGMLSATLTAHGTVDDPTLDLKVAGRGLKSPSALQAGAASADVDAHYANKVVALSATLKQPEIQPIELRGQVPLDLRKTIETKHLDEQAPIEGVIKLPKSSLAFVTKFVPQLRYVEGSASADVRVAGTISKPVTSGAVNIDVAAIRLKDQRMPPIGGLHGSINFAGDEVTVRGFRGEIGGGTFGLSGKAKLTPLTNPELDLQITSSDLLLLRNDTVTVRADSNVKIAGPLTAANVTGNVAITNSRFFREIEILPLELPGRPAPKPRAVAARNTSVSFPNPPLRDWTFDLAITSKDPFEIRGNLANGGAFIDLKLRGTGLQPYLEGSVRIENFVASLPFSKLNVSYGYVYFSADAPFEPRLDIRATSNMRDYNINVFIYGDPLEPQTVFTSEPPLPQEDIVSLLATGTTTQELTGSADVVAGRAAVLVFQKYYRKIFKKREPSEKNSFFERFDVDVGSIDQKTGKQAATARFELGENFYLVGDLDVEGDFRGQLKYLLRFR